MTTPAACPICTTPTAGCRPGARGTWHCCGTTSTTLPGWTYISTLLTGGRVYQPATPTDHPTGNRPTKAEKGSGRTGKTGRYFARELAASLLAAGETIKDSAKTAKMGERTLRRWLSEDATFSELVVRLRGEIITSATGQLIGIMSQGTAVLRELLDSENEAIRYKCAAKLVELALRATDAIEFEQRLKSLEVKMRNES